MPIAPTDATLWRVVATETSGGEQTPPRGHSAATHGRLTAMSDPEEQSFAITITGLVNARWVLIGLLTAAMLIVKFDPVSMASVIDVIPVATNPWAFAAATAAWALANFMTSRLVRKGLASEALAGANLLVDAIAITILLGLSGGASNPFTTVYFVPITLATQVSPRWTWTLAGVSLAGFASLFVAADLPPAPPGHESHFSGHLQGMWVAFGVAGGLITYFVHKIAISLAKQREELSQLREEAIQDRHLASVGSLAAGAAHELGTPLGTIGFLAGEAPHMTSAELVEAVDTIKDELKRCKEIVQRMSSPDARVSQMGRAQGGWSWHELADAVDTRGEIPIHVEIHEKAQGAATVQPREPIEQILREMVKNAAEACRRRSGSNGVEVEIGYEEQWGTIVVEDDGIGMDKAALEAAFDPFYTTKPEGEGMGMGLYIARAQIRQLGGTIDIDSAPGRGTRIEIQLPLTFETIDGSLL